MATLQIPENGKAVKGRTQKTLPSVDLTAMVDLAFLLITFFMLTTSLAKMRALDLAKPVPEGEGQWPESRTMTILLGKNNQAVYYMGKGETATMKVTDLASIKKEILGNKLKVASTHHDEKGKRMLVIIKPTNTAVYRNFVDIIDEMNINSITTYAVDDKNILVQERNFMQERGI